MLQPNPSELWSFYEEVQKELEETESNLKRIGKASIKVHSFISRIEKLPPEFPEYEKFKEASSGVNKRLGILATRRNKEKTEMEEEMESAHIRVKRITEVQGDGNDRGDEGNRGIYGTGNDRGGNRGIYGTGNETDRTGNNDRTEEIYRGSNNSTSSFHSSQSQRDDFYGAQSQSSRTSDFYGAQSSRMDNIIMSTMDSLESLRLQGKYIDSTRTMINDGLRRMGLSNRFINRIESRVTMDKVVFIGLFIFLVLVIMVLVTR